MGSIKANWHLDVPLVDDSDPFADPPVDVREGERIDLRDPEALRAKLVALTIREGQLSDRGITCPIKVHPDSCCSACPLAGSVRHLCKVGQAQEQTTMAMLAADA